MAIEIVSFPPKNGGSFHSYVKLPEGMYNMALQIKSIKWSFNKGESTLIWHVNSLLNLFIDNKWQIN